MHIIARFCTRFSLHIVIFRRCIFAQSCWEDLSVPSKDSCDWKTGYVLMSSQLKSYNSKFYKKNVVWFAVNYSHAILLSKLVKQIQSACKGDNGWHTSMLNLFLATLPNCKIMSSSTKCPYNCVSKNKTHQIVLVLTFALQS